MSYTHTLVLSTSGSGRSDTPIVMSTLCAQILVSKSHFPLKNKMNKNETKHGSLEK